MSKLIYLDTFSYSSFHEDFNASSLKMFSDIYTSVDYYATKSSREAVESLLRGLPENVVYHRICEIRDGGSFRNALRHLFSAFTNILLVLFSHRDTVVYINYNSLWGLRLIALISERRGIKVILQCHGELESLASGRKLNFLSDLSLKRIAAGYYRGFSNLFFCVAGDSILANLKTVLDERTYGRFISFEHPFVRHRTDRHDAGEKNGDPTINLAVLGYPSKSKGIDDFVSLTKRLGHSKYRYYSLGHIGRMKELFDSEDIGYIPGSDTGFVPMESMQRYIEKMDAILFFYPPDSYRFTASGAILSAIASGKPIFSYHNSYFNPIFEKHDIGRLFNSLDELCSFLEGKDGARLASFRSAGTDFISPEVEAAGLRELLLERNLIE